MAAQMSPTSTEGENFNFGTWIAQNNLSEIKHLFIKHGATNLQSLQLTSKALQDVMGELFTQHPAQIPSIMIAIQNINAHINEEQQDYIVVTEDEDVVIKEIKKNIITLDDIEKELNSLKQSVFETTQRLNADKSKRIEATKDKINKVFDDIYKALKAKQTSFLQQLDNDDEKEVDIISSSLEQLQSEKSNLSSTLKRCHHLIKSSKNNDTETKQRRKEQLITIGTEANDKFNKTENELKNNIKTAADMVNKPPKVNIDFLLNDATYNKILKKISKLGLIQIDDHEKRDVLQDDDDVLIQQLQGSLKQQKIEYQERMSNAFSVDENSSVRWYYDQEEKENNLKYRIGWMFKLNDQHHIVFMDDKSLKKNIATDAVTCKPNINGDDVLNDVEQMLKTLLGKCVANINCGEFVPYTVSQSTGGGHNMDALISSNFDQNVHTNNRLSNGWIQATFGSQVQIRRIDMAAPGITSGWGYWGIGLNGNGRKLQYLSGGSWKDIMEMSNFKQGEIKSFVVNVTTNAIRVYSAQTCYIVIGCWRFFK